uniref:Coiled-coil domain-containing protein 34-like isoform X2 n=1 Tax=Crassostrea virginica TaxID=6565 RepID=A0A8B8BV37_CRAVI|nr:coiled-coil domain-containing protein 34-like isoform X2 [Crassostrea virginica]
MNTRPRPVTATVTKPKWMEPHVIPRRSRSLESNGSTASLTSVLDHDSYESPDLSEDEWERDEFRRNVENEEKTVEQDRRTARNRPSSCKARALAKSQDRVKVQRKNRITAHQRDRFSEYDTTSGQSENMDTGLSPWEQWLIQKTKEERVKRQQMKKHKVEVREQKEQKAKEKIQKEVKAEEKRTEWLKQKNYEETLRKKLEKQRIKTEAEIKAQQNMITKMKAERKFEEWKEKKDNMEREKKEQEIQKKREIELEEKCKKIKAQQKYEEWLRSAKNRPKSAQSFGYSGGKLTGYHDTGAYPAPTYYNPIPWHPNPIPKTQKTERSKSRPRSKKYVWNPDKYF